MPIPPLPALAILALCATTPAAAQTMAPMPGMAAPTVAKSGSPAAEGAEVGSVIKLLGHLSVAEELVRMGHTDEAMPHFEHLDGSMSASYGPWLARLGEPAFASRAHELAMTARTGNTSEVLKAIADMRDGLDGALRTLVTGTRDPGVAVLRGVTYAVKATAPEYGAALKGRVIANRTDWEDGRGYLMAAEARFEEVAPMLVVRPGGDASVARLRADLAALDATWPSPLPPVEAVTPPDDLQGDVDVFAAEAAALR